jgi:hypothetical protein
VFFAAAFCANNQKAEVAAEFFALTSFSLHERLQRARKFIFASHGIPDANRRAPRAARPRPVGSRQHRAAAAFCGEAGRRAQALARRRTRSTRRKQG